MLAILMIKGTKHACHISFVSDQVCLPSFPKLIWQNLYGKHVWSSFLSTWQAYLVPIMNQNGNHTQSLPIICRILYTNRVIVMQSQNQADLDWQHARFPIAEIKFFIDAHFIFTKIQNHVDKVSSFSFIITFIVIHDCIALHFK